MMGAEGSHEAGEGGEVGCRHGWDEAARGQPCPTCVAEPRGTVHRPPGELTARQAEVLEWLTEQGAANLAMPTIRELADHFAISINAMFAHVTALRRKGYLWARGRRLRLAARALREQPELAALRAENARLRAQVEVMQRVIEGGMTGDVAQFCAGVNARLAEKERKP